MYKDTIEEWKGTPLHYIPSHVIGGMIRNTFGDGVRERVNILEEVMNLNDHGHKSFGEIADWLDDNGYNIEIGG